MRFAVIGLGYVGLSNAILLSTKHDVVCYDIDQSKLKLIENKKPPIKDKLISEYLRNKKLRLTTTAKIGYEIVKSNFIIISTPTNFEESENTFDTSSLDKILKKLSSLNTSSTIIIKSTLPEVILKELIKDLKVENIFLTEFKRR